MIVKQTHRLPIITLSLLLLLCVSLVQAAPINSTWTCESGNYSATTCWDPLLAYAPYNRGSLAFEVTIPDGSGTISMDVNVPPCIEVSTFTLAEGRTFKVLPGKCYSVIGQADISGIVWGNGGDFVALVAAFPGCKAQVWADDGGYVEIDAPTYCAEGLNAYQTNYTLLSSDGAGSYLNLSGMTELNDGVSIGGGRYNHTIIAQNGGSIDLSGLKNIIGPTGDETLNINVNPTGNIRLDSLTTVFHAGEAGRVLFNVDGVTSLTLPSLASISSAEFHVTKGATLNAQNAPWTSSAEGLNAYQTNYTLLSSDGAGSYLNLSGMTELNDGVSIGGGRYNHTIIAQNGGSIDLSGLKNIIGPKGDEVLSISAVNGTLDMSSLQTIVGNTGTVNFVLDEGGTQFLGDVSVDRNITITLNDPNDLLVACSDLSLGTMLMVSNPGKGMLVLRGDFTYAHKDETKASFGESYVFLNGDGPQELEVGGLDLDVFWTELANDNFGFGQMVVGHDEPNSAPGAVLLVDQVDNGNRGGLTGYEEALYLFGKDGEDGLRLLNGSILYMGGLKVYAMLDGVMTDLTTLFGPDEVMIPFDEGWLCLDRPELNDSQNLIKNGGFETGNNPPTTGNPVVTLSEGSTDIDYWTVTKDTMNWTHETSAADSTFHDGERYADLSSTKTGKGAVSQVISTEPNELYHVWFDMANNPLAEETTALRVSAADSSEEFTATQTEWQTKTWRFVAKDNMTTLTFEGADDPDTPFSVLIDNVFVDGNEPDGCGLTISVIGEGSISEPGTGNFDYTCSEQVCVTAVADPNFKFCGWQGTAVDAGVITDEDQTQSTICITVDDQYTLIAVFEEIVYPFPLDDDPGWIMTGEWEFGVPTGHDCGVYGGADPTSGHTGSNVIGVNLDGCYDPNISPLYDVVAGPFDLSGYRDVKLRFWRWLNTDIPEFVENRIEMSFDGSNWNSLWIQGERTEIIDAWWMYFEYDIPADCQPIVYIRWTYEVKRERAYAYTGWNIDDIQLTGCQDECQ